MNLVVQGPEATAPTAIALAELCGSAAPEAVGPQAWRLRGATRREDVAAWCAAHRIDHAWVPEGRRFADVRLLAMDMDSTLITIESIDELGKAAGRGAEIAALTERAMRGEIDYAASLRRRVALLEGLPEDALDHVYDERLRLSPGAEALVAHCKRFGVALLLVSGGFSCYASRLQQRLGLDETLAHVLEIESGLLTGRILGPVVDAAAKAAKFRHMAQRLGAAKTQTVAIGDGANDLLMMAEAGISVAWRAKPVARAGATHALDHAGLDGVLHLFEE